jgi:hypothetical protein
MKKLFLILVIFTLIFCNNKQIVKEDFSFKALIEKDISKLSKLLSELDTMKNENSEWIKGDRQYFNFWLEGAKSELKGDFKNSVESYIRALNVSRFEMSTYDVKLPLGRTYLQIGNKSKAISILNEFKEEANFDINDTEAEWGLSEEAKLKVRKDLETCEKLLSLINK